jgi:hypothetical protein
VRATIWPTLLLSTLDCLMNSTNSHVSTHKLVATCHLWSSVHLPLFRVPLTLLNTSPLDNWTVHLTGLTSSYSLHRYPSYWSTVVHCNPRATLRNHVFVDYIGCLNLMFCWPCIVVYQYNETNVMHFSFNLLRIKCLYMFRALLTHPQEALHKRHLVYCTRILSVGSATVAIYQVPFV